MSTAVKRACDVCHRRKARCNGIKPCRYCSSARLTCTYNAIPQKKGPKGSKAKVISELRETQRASSLSAKVQSRLSGINSPPCAMPLQPNMGLLSNELIKESIEFFFAHMYPTMPILDRQRLEQQSLYMGQSLDTYCLLTSLCALMLLQPGMVMPGNDSLFKHPGTTITSSHLLIEEAMRVRKGYDYMESPTLNTLCTSYFIFGCYYALEIHEKAWYHLREAATLVHMGGLTQDATYTRFDCIESSRRRRLYWLVFVAERTYALRYNRPLSLPAAINPPTISDDPSDPLVYQLNGFIMMVDLFRPFEGAFMLLWNRTRNEYSPSYLGALQEQVSGMKLPYMDGCASQIGDTHTNQQWMDLANWHLRMQIECLPPPNEDMCQYPVLRDPKCITSQVAIQETNILSVPLVTKLMEIACSLVDVLAMQPSIRDPLSRGPQQHLQALLQLVSILPEQYHLFPLLLSKVHDILPRLANPMLQRAPNNSKVRVTNHHIVQC
ncbi:hypothetical protein PG999_004410 [Apiospora kogelbergensis]|uniref:Zn(2)-C6 fungal-type domain-containing protein n=1 Tax=Apiospora kogelbergensis TaxID=1337665 RepID=A0AAW0QZ69_9PEZI